MYQSFMFNIVKKARLCLSSMLVTVLVTNPLGVHAQQQDTSARVTKNSAYNKIKLQRKRRGINTELVDQGDYYNHPDGRQIRMLRKKNVYVVESTDSARSMQRIKDTFSERVKEVTSHRLGGRNVVRIDNGEAVKSRRNEQFDITADMLESSDNTIRSMRPVFSNEQGGGDILLMPKLTVRLASGVDLKKSLQSLSSLYGLSVDRKLRVTGNVYSLTIKSSITESQQFSLVRRVMNNPIVEWAEPQFIAKPDKAEFIPLNNEFFNTQSHLRNTGFRRTRCDTDCDATDAWDIDNANGVGAVAGDGMVIAIIDDGIDTSSSLIHEDLDIWTHPNESENDFIDDGFGVNIGYVGDIRGYDFVDETNNGLLDGSGNGPCPVFDDGTVGPDNDPSPQPTSNCITAEGDDVENDNHGTAVAGLAAALNNTVGVVGTAFRAEILPIRLISDFDGDEDFCSRAAEAMEYAGQYADVVNNSWSLTTFTCNALDDAIENVVNGTVMSDRTNNQIFDPVNVSKRTGGSPVLFASGNSAGGWVKASIQVSAGEHSYEWRFLRDNLFEENDDDDGNSAWLDDITWPDGSTEDFESGTLQGNGFNIGNVEASNSCIAGCVGNLTGNAAWSIQDSPEVLFSGSSAAQINAADSDCGNTYLHIIRDEPIDGNLTFWVWVDTEIGADKFELLIDGNEVLSFGDDLNAFLTNSVEYPANLSTTIAVGASNSGDLSGTTNVDPTAETRAYYSQYGQSLDILAPSSDQRVAITTTDRTGVAGYNNGDETIGNNNYTNTFGGTSAATPIVAGVAAAMLAVNPALSANDVKLRLRESANKIGSLPYDQTDAEGSTRNDFYGYGRVNMYRALLAANGDPIEDPIGSPTCSNVTQSISFVSAHNIFQPEPLFFCPAIGAVPQVASDGSNETICLPIKASNGNFSVICI